MRITVELHIDEPMIDDIDDLADAVRNAVEEVAGKVDYTVLDYGLNFELQDD